MTNYLLAILAFLLMYKGVKIIIFKWRIKEELPKVIEGAESFSYKRGKTGVFFIHGFAATPHDLKEAGKYLAEKDITVYCPLLPGHGTTPYELSKTKVKDLENAIEEGLEKIKPLCDRLFIAGLSFGGNLMFKVAEKHQFAGLISLGTPIVFKRNKTIKFGRFLVPIIIRLKTHSKNRNAEINEKQKRIYYKIWPLNSLTGMLKVLNKSKKSLKKISAPALIMQSSTDNLITEKSAEYIFSNLASKNKKLVWIPNSNHVFIMDENKDKVFKEMHNFIVDTQ